MKFPPLNFAALIWTDSRCKTLHLVVSNFINKKGSQISLVVICLFLPGINQNTLVINLDKYLKSGRKGTISVS